MTQVEQDYLWAQHYTQEVERSINYYNVLNQNQPVHTRKMTHEEFEAVFGEKPESCHKLKVSGKEEFKMKILINTIPKVKKFCNVAQNFMHDVDITSDRYKVDGKSIMGLFSLDLSKPINVNVHSDDIEMAECLFKEFEVK